MTMMTKECKKSWMMSRRSSTVKKSTNRLMLAHKKSWTRWTMARKISPPLTITMMLLWRSKIRTNRNEYEMSSEYDDRYKTDKYKFEWYRERY